MRKSQPRLAREVHLASSIYLERPTKTSGEGLANFLRFPTDWRDHFRKRDGRRATLILSAHFVCISSFLVRSVALLYGERLVGYRDLVIRAKGSRDCLHRRVHFLEPGRFGRNVTIFVTYQRSREAWSLPGICVLPRFQQTIAPNLPDAPVSCLVKWPSSASNVLFALIRGHYYPAKMVKLYVATSE